MHTIPLALSEQQVSPGVLGFVVVALLGLALFLLIRSMNKQIRRINFDDGSGDPGPHAAGTEPAPGDAKTPADTTASAATGAEEKNAGSAPES